MLNPVEYLKAKKSKETEVELSRVYFFDSNFEKIIGVFCRTSYDIHHRWLLKKYREKGLGSLALNILEKNAKKAGHKIILAMSRKKEIFNFLIKNKYKFYKDQKIPLLSTARNWPRFNNISAIKKE